MVETEKRVETTQELPKLNNSNNHGRSVGEIKKTKGNEKKYVRNRQSTLMNLRAECRYTKKLC